MIEGPPGATRHAFYDRAPVGLAGTLTFALLDQTGAEVIAESPAQIVAIKPTIYRRSFVVPDPPSVPADWLVQWDPKIGGVPPVTEELWIRTEPLHEQVPGNFGPGTAGAALARLFTGPLSIVSPIGRTAHLTLQRGDDYTAALGRALVIPVAEGDSWPPDLNGWAIDFEVASPDGGWVDAGDGSVLVPAGAGQSVRVDLPSAETAALALGLARYRVKASKLTQVVTLRHGRLTVSP